MPSPAELLFNRRINTRLGQLHSSSYITEEQKISLTDKRAAHLKSSRALQEKYAPQQPIWYTEDGSPDWKPGYIDTQDVHPDSYWIIAETNRRIRRNRHDIKQRHVVMPLAPKTPSHRDDLCLPSHNDALPVITNPSTPVRMQPVPSTLTQAETPHSVVPTVMSPAKRLVPSNPPPLRRSGRNKKSTEDPDFVYA